MGSLLPSLILGGLALLGLAGWILSRRRAKRDRSLRTGAGGSREEDGESGEEEGRKGQDEERRRREEEERKRQEVRKRKIDDILAKGGMLAEMIRRRPDLPDDQLEVLYLAATQKEVSFNLGVDQVLTLAPYPTSHMDIVPVTEASRLSEVLPSQAALDDDAFFQAYADGRLLRPEYYERSEMRKRLYILWDVSGSMHNENAGMRLPDGEIVLRETFARGVIASLLAEAVRGEAEYLLRPFDDTVYDLRSAMNREEATRLLEWIVTEGMRGNDTQIGRAVKKAIDDIRAKLKSEVGMNYILLITDGQDNGLTRQYLVDNLGSDVKLFVVLIGTTYSSGDALAPYVIGTY
jgi:hypothetical protein